MDKLQERQLQEIIRNQRNFLISQANKSQRPAGHNVGDEDLSKVASSDVIGKGSSNDLIK